MLCTYNRKFSIKTKVRKKSVCVFKDSTITWWMLTEPRSLYRTSIRFLLICFCECLQSGQRTPSSKSLEGFELRAEGWWIKRYTLTYCCGWKSDLTKEQAATLVFSKRRIASNSYNWPPQVVFPQHDLVIVCRLRRTLLFLPAQAAFVIQGWIGENVSWPRWFCHECKAKGQTFIYLFLPLLVLCVCLWKV